MIEDMTLRNYSPNTIQSHVECIAGVASHSGASLERLGPEQIRAYLFYLVRDRRVSSSYYKKARWALRLLYRVTLVRDDVL